MHCTIDPPSLQPVARSGSRMNGVRQHRDCHYKVFTADGKIVWVQGSPLCYRSSVVGSFAGRSFDLISLLSPDGYWWPHNPPLDMHDLPDYVCWSPGMLFFEQCNRFFREVVVRTAPIDCFVVSGRVQNKRCELVNFKATKSDFLLACLLNPHVQITSPIKTQKAVTTER